MVRPLRWITRKRARADARLLEASAERYKRLVASFPGIVYLLELQDDGPPLPVYVSPQIETLLGMSAEEWESDPTAVMRIVHPDDQSLVISNMAAFKEGRPGQDLRMLKTDGSVVWMRPEASFFEQGGRSFVQGILLDLTQHVEIEYERQMLVERQIEQIERLAELNQLKGDFIANVSHELRTPLTSIVGYLQVLAGGEAGSLTKDQGRILTVIGRNASRLNALVSDLLFITQLDAGKLELDRAQCGLGALARDSIEAISVRAAEKGVSISLDAGDEDIEIEGDALRLSQVLDNLVSNAVKFTPEGGSVAIAIRSDSHGVELTVADTGIGIPSADQGRLFERFYRASNATRQAIQGTGLGLVITRAIVEAHGGAISFASRHPQGTVFTVRLPAAVEERAA
jgi:PAS domain S-box-containing protein